MPELLAGLRPAPDRVGNHGLVLLANRLLRHTTRPTRNGDMVYTCRLQEVHMAPRFIRLPLVLLAVFTSLGSATALIGWFGWQAWQETPESQFRQARTLWQSNAITHYRMEANFSNGFAQCHYDIEVKTRAVIRVHGLTCLGSATTNTLTIESIFEVFGAYVDERVCGPNGCSCEGAYVVKASYDPDWGYPRTISTVFQRSLLETLLSDESAVNCRQTRAQVRRIEILSFTPLP